LNLKDWFRDRTVRKVAKYGVPAAAGKFVNAISGLITMAVLARYLGPGPFGVIAVFRTVVTVVDLYANFNTWQALIKYGTEAIADKRPDDVKRMIKLAFVIDVTTAILGTFVVFGLTLIIPERFGWSAHEAGLCAIYGLTLVSKVSGTTDGIFRICDAYRVQAVIAGIGSVLSTAAVVIAVALGAGFDGCVIALVSGEIASNIALTIASLWVANQAGYSGWMKVKLAGLRTTFPGIVRFFVATNAQLTVKTTQGEIDMLVIGSMLGKESAGLFRVVKQLGTIPGRVFLPFELVLFTELARCSANHDYAGFRRLLLRAVAIAGVGSLMIWVVAATFARPLIELVAGDQYVSVASAFRWYLLAMVVQVCSTTVMRSMIALGRPGTAFLFDAASLVVLIAAVLFGAYQWGLVGVAGALLLHKSVQLAWSTQVVWRLLRSHESKLVAKTAAEPAV
jgi:O-antigen/teichoic acid export membrane protein